MIELNEVTKEYRQGEVVTPVLRGVTLKIQKGEFVAIRGPSGSGKSTVMHIIGLLDRPTGGQYLFDGEDVGKLTDVELAALRNKRIGFVFQAFYLLPRTSLLDNVLLPTWYSSAEVQKDAKKRALELLTKVGLTHRVNNFPNQISGGEMQRAAICRALINDPDILMADEPTGNLDHKNSEQIMSILEELHNDGKTVVMVTHEEELADRASRIIFVRDGIVVEK
ncbi:MAG: ABC transporter ATP-binding protein [bacterium]